MSRFVHLHTHSHYSLLEALPKIPELVKEAKKNEMSALALTDSGNLYGAIEFYKECSDAGIKPIIGVDTYMAARSRFDKEARIDSARSRLVLLAMNDTGYKNLLKLVTASYLEGFYYKPRIDREVLERQNDGLIVILPSFANVNLKESIDWYKRVFGPDRFYLEITHHPEIGGHEEKMRERIAIARETDTPIVAAHDVYYLKPDDRPARETLLSIQSHLGSGSGRGWNDEEDDFSFITPKQAEKLFKSTPDALENVEKIVGMCELKLDLGKWVFPNYTVESGKTYEEEFRDMVEGGFDLRGIKETPEIRERVEYEMDLIRRKGFFPYFLVVGDLLRYARENRILTNIRGSVAGSMVTYLAGITSVNPLEYGLPFERFLNPDRPLPPDIDMDFADNRRDEMIDYARKKYGAEHVAQIGTFGTMMARGAVRDVTRAMSFPPAVGDRIAKQIPIGMQGFPMTIDKAKKENPEFKKMYNEEQDVKRIVDMAEKIEGGARHISVHAAGVVIAPSALTDFTALQYDTKGEKKVITQYDMYSIEEAGLLKFDFLGLKNLSIIADTIERIKKIEGKEIDIDKIPLDDKKTFAMLARGETEGTFQLNGDAMTKFLVDLKPTVIHDLNAMVALYRPGPMQFIPLFIERKHKPETVKYLDPALKPILEKTYGVLVYQDDLLMIAKDIAGYTWGEVDKFRKAVGKKIPEEMLAQKEKFIKGVVEHSGWPQRKAEELWTWIEPFAAYGFNKAHSVSYGRVAYQTAYLKANFPEIYMSAVLSADSGDVESIGTTVAECKRMGIEVLPPSVNESYSQFTVPPRATPSERYKIRFGLTTIKNFGQGVSTAIIEERKNNGKYKSLIDFLDRVKDKNLNKKSLESLIKAGALDDLPAQAGFGERGQMLGNIDRLLGYHKEQQKAGGGLSLFDTSTMPQLRLDPALPATQKDKLTWEKELLGLYISGHPLDSHREKLEKRDMNLKKLTNCRENTECVIAGIINEVREATTKGNERMVFIRLEDLTGDTDVVIFPRVYEQFKQFILPEACIAIKGKVSKRNGETSFIAEKVKAL
ncbi:DNA polymerase III subunit alpha [Candidatus Parcubacteria bacterium]|nr:DNA polymerase III subunit alpha [Candidatus Parcubacteria bacterium]